MPACLGRRADGLCRLPLWVGGTLFTAKEHGMITALRFKSTSQSGSPESAYTIDAFLKALETDSTAKRRCRELKASGSPEYQEHKRTRVPAWTIGARFNGARSNGNVIPEGYVTVDFDDIENCEQLKADLSLCPHVMLAARSAGGCGVFCVIAVADGIQTSPDKIKELWEELSNYTGIPVGKTKTEISGPHIDGSCSDAARLRIESYDPCYVYNPDPMIWKPYAELAYESYLGSAIYDMARCFGGAPWDGHENEHARNAYALAALSVTARTRVYGESGFCRGQYFPFKSQTVVLGRTGSSKTNTLRVLQEAVNFLGVRQILTASDAALIDAVAKSAAVCEGKGDDAVWTQRPEPLALLEVIDEAGDDRAARGRRDYAAQAHEIRRRLFDDKANLSNALSRPAPSFPVRSAYTGIQLSTPERWAETICRTDGAAGDARRVSEFWLPSPLDDTDSVDAVTLGRLMRRTDEVSLLPDVSRLTFMLGGLDSRGSVMLPCNASVWALDGGLRYLKGSTNDDVALQLSSYRTLVMSFATACAYARGGSSIEDWDVRAGASLFLGVMQTRRRLVPMTYARVETQTSNITEMILGIVRSADGGVRFDKLKKRCASPDYAKVLTALVADGTLIQYRAAVGKQTRTLIREATDDERDARTRPDFSEERANRDKVARPEDSEHPFERLQSAEYAMADDAGKQAKLDAYRAEHETSHPLVAGQRDDSLRSLAVKLHGAGLDDAFAEAWFFSLCDSLGDEYVSPRTKKRLWRPIRA